MRKIFVTSCKITLCISETETFAQDVGRDILVIIPGADLGTFHRRLSLQFCCSLLTWHAVPFIRATRYLLPGNSREVNLEWDLQKPERKNYCLCSIPIAGLPDCPYREILIRLQPCSSQDSRRSNWNWDSQTVQQHCKWHWAEQELPSGLVLLTLWVFSEKEMVHLEFCWQRNLLRSFPSPHPPHWHPGLLMCYVLGILTVTAHCLALFMF